MRRNVPITYIIENNGVYGLTKGQFSATADLGSDEGRQALMTSCRSTRAPSAHRARRGFVARSFSGDRKQLTPLVQGGVRSTGTAPSSTSSARA